MIVDQKFAIHSLTACWANLAVNGVAAMLSSWSTIFDDEFTVDDEKRLFVGTIANRE